MVAAIGAGLEFFRQVLALRGYRQEILSADVANASTPGFKAVDLDFGAALSAATGGGAGGLVTPPPARRLWLVDDPRQMGSPAESAGTPPSAAGFVKYQADSEVTLDGNSVDLDHEKVMAAENAVHYEAAATFTTQTVRMLMTAITGSPSQSGGG